MDLKRWTQKLGKIGLSLSLSITNPYCHISFGEIEQIFTNKKEEKIGSIVCALKTGKQRGKKNVY